jgi:hypothetical protein
VVRRFLFDGNVDLALPGDTAVIIQNQEKITTEPLFIDGSVIFPAFQQVTGFLIRRFFDG